jgi:hypothetical protein
LTKGFHVILHEYEVQAFEYEQVGSVAQKTAASPGNCKVYCPCIRSVFSKLLIGEVSRNKKLNASPGNGEV